MIARKPHPAEDALRAAYEAMSPSPVRAEAFARFAKTGLPHRRVEAWKWTDVRQALAKKPDEATSPVRRLKAPSNAMVLRIVDGQIKDIPDLPIGVQLGIGKVVALTTKLPMINLAGALAATSITLRIEGNIDVPLFISVEGQGHSQIKVELAAQSQAHIIEDHGAQTGFSNTALHYVLADNARLSRLVHHKSGAGAVHVVSADISLAKSAKLDQFSLGFGARLARLETWVTYQGEDARARLNGAYLLDGERHADQTFHVDHGVENCTTAQLVRGVVKDSARGVFQGKFHVARAGQHTDASMNHDAIVLNAGACVNAKPELEIYADDVACAHGNTSGALDENALFYMRQRGLDEAEAKALLIRAFVGAAFDDLKDETLHDMMMEPIKLWLEEKL